MSKGMLPGHMARQPEPDLDHLAIDVIKWTDMHMRKTETETAQWITVHYRVVKG